MSERSIHDVDTDRPPPNEEGPVHAILDALEEVRAALDDLNEGQDEVQGSLRGIHGAIKETERNLGGKLNAVHETIKDVGRNVAQLSRDVARALQVNEQNRTAVASLKKELEEMKRAASG